jgi:hypothetical protein
MGSVIAAAETMVAEHVEEHGGRLIKSRGEGDSTLSVFTRATSAAAAAMSLQAALGARRWPEGITFGMRLALHTGQAELREGDYYGPTLNRAARLRGLAGGGHVLCSRVTAELLADDLPAGSSLLELGEASLRGLSQSETVFALLRDGDIPPPALTAVDQPNATTPEMDAAPATHLPAALAHWPTEGLRGVRLVGREAEMELLDRGWNEALAGGRRAVFIAGEPGVGKTRLAFEAARAAHGQGAVVLFGRCEEDLGVPYQPFVEAIGDYVVAADPADLRRQVGPWARELGRILPVLVDKMPDLPPPTEADAETERYLLFEGVVDLLRAIAADTPAVLVIDDLQWAARPTLLLLRHLLHAPTTASILVLATYRDTELVPGQPLADVLADLRRINGVERMELKGLAREAVGGFMAAAGGHDLNEEASRFARRLWAETGGNPFFLSEVLTDLAESGSVAPDESGRWGPTSGGGHDDIHLP